jgi:hypothetical protein
MANKQTPTRRQLTVEQKYLLQRVPSVYRMNGYKRSPELVEVKRARALVKRFDERERLLECRAGKRNEALRQKAVEAIYFDTPEKALAIVRQCEKMLKGCED